MKRSSFLLFFLLPACYAPAAAQKRPLTTVDTFYVVCDQQQLALGESARITYVYEGAGGGRFVAPDWGAAHLDVLGTSQSSNISMNDREMKSTIRYSYQVTPVDTGRVEVPAAILQQGERELRTAPLRLYLTGDPSEKAPERLKQTPVQPPAAPEQPKQKLKTIRI